MPAMRWMPLLILLFAFAGALACSDEDLAADAGQSLGLRLQYLDADCEPLPGGTLPPEVALVELSVFRASDASLLQQMQLLVDPLARCVDAQGREFGCPFDVDGDGQRERYFAFEPLPQGVDVVVVATLKDQVSTPRWSGHSDPLRVGDAGATVATVALRPADASCGQ